MSFHLIKSIRFLFLKVIPLLFVIPLPLKAQDDLTPFALTSTQTNITAFVDQGSLEKQLAQAATRTVAIAMSSSPGGAAYVNQPSVHHAVATAEVFVPDDSTQTYFQTAFSTRVETLTTGPLFSKASANGQGLVISTVSPDAQTLNFTWEWEKSNPFTIQTNPTASFSYVTDVINVVQLSPTSSLAKTTTIGFRISMENGKVTTHFTDYSRYSNGTVVNDIKGDIEQWFGTKINDMIPGQVTLKDDAGSLTVEIPLLQNLSNNFTILAIENLHEELSIEAPPRATNQVDENAGSLDDNGAQLSWDADTGTLTIAPVVIDLLNDRSSNRFNDKFADDPLNGGFLEIDPLQWVKDADGRKYFTGDQVRLLDKDNNVLFRASLPSLVFEDELFELQGFNLFAPILNILETNTGTSQWLQDYTSKISIDALLLPELFIGFDPMGMGSGDSFWNKNFSTSARAILSFSGIPSNIPEPLSIYLVMIGLIALMIFRQRLKMNS